MRNVAVDHYNELIDESSVSVSAAEEYSFSYYERIDELSEFELEIQLNEKYDLPVKKITTNQPSLPKIPNIPFNNFKNLSITTIKEPNN